MRAPSMVIAAASILVLFTSSGAVAASRPENDTRKNAQRITAVPSVTLGTTLRAKAESSDPTPRCASIGPTVWYRFVSDAGGRMAVALEALGQLEAVVSVYRVDRSHTAALGCSKTDPKGLAGLSFRTSPRKAYLILVGQQSSSIPGKFKLLVQRPEGSARPPGNALPAAGAWGSVNRLIDPDDAWAVNLRPGTSYMFNLVAGAQRCLRFELYKSTVDAFRLTQRVKEFGCDGFRTFTPGPDGGGTYTVRVTRDGRYRGTQSYRLHVAPATVDDGAPGVPLQNGQTVAGTLSPREIDVRDVYRFSSTGESMMTASLRVAPNTRFDLVLLSDTGSEVACACDEAGPITLRETVERGHYFLAVRSATGSKGPYKLTLLVREVTTTEFLMNGSTQVELAPGQSAQATAMVRSATGAPSATATGGKVRFQFDRLDPFSGWQFVQLSSIAVTSSGQAQFAWTPPSVGHWRAHAVFWGTLGAAPSEAGFVTILVEDPMPGG